MTSNDYTTLKKCWYRYFTGRQGGKPHFEIKLVCTECHNVWDRQSYAFAYCPGCGRQVVEIEEAENSDK